MFDFSRYNNARDLKHAYNQLARIYHPDFGGNEETMKELTRAYKERLSVLKKEGRNKNLLFCRKPSERKETVGKKRVEYASQKLLRNNGVETNGRKTTMGQEKAMSPISKLGFYEPIRVIHCN